MIHLKAASFPVGKDNSPARLANDFFISSTEVTYETWYKVRIWAIANGYSFNTGRQGSPNSGHGIIPDERKNEPVTYISWRDAIVFCNALTEYLNTYIEDENNKLAFVYTSDAEFKNPIKIASDTRNICTNQGCIDNPYINLYANGFRLPTNLEWELAARYRGFNKVDGAIEMPENIGVYWSPGNFISGANNENDINDYAVYNHDTSEISDLNAQKVASKNANHAGIYDMSGNVWEWVFDLNSNNDYRIIKGGTYSYSKDYIQISHIGEHRPFLASHQIGLRLAMNYFN